MQSKLCACCHMDPVFRNGLCRTCTIVQDRVDEACRQDVMGCRGGQGRTAEAVADDGWAALVIVLIAIAGVLAICAFGK